LIIYDAWKLATPPEYEREDEGREPYVGNDLFGDMMRAIDRAEKGASDESTT
jgi:hypothetical protein